MHVELILTPAGSLRFQQSKDDSGVTVDTWMAKVAAAFASSQAEGLFALATARPEVPPPASFGFWRDFGCRYLTRLCSTPASGGHRIDPIEVPVEAELAILLLSAPPMQGAESLNVKVSGDLWTQLDI